MSATNELSFEQAYAELEDVVRRLEAGTLPLAEAVTLYERGQQLSARCQALLDSAELRIQALAEDGSTTPLQP
ncbi:MAG: exodeoxyribonuclease VII small subunit [Anaerolineae bacterium]|jgi:exodeoxyribonuclease VII small subunit|nr:exodeoxyribonuclease VII small subunit [Anaerolineae bacterium]